MGVNLLLLCFSQDDVSRNCPYYFFLHGMNTANMPKGKPNLLIYFHAEMLVSQEDILSYVNIDGRWDLITPGLTRRVAEQLFEDFSNFIADPAALLGYDPFSRMA